MTDIARCMGLAEGNGECPIRDRCRHYVADPEADPHQTWVMARWTMAGGCREFLWNGRLNPNTRFEREEE